MSLPSWNQQMCPILTAADVQARATRKGPESKLVGVVDVAPKPPEEPEAVGCQGPSCGFFTPIVGADGKVVGGHCAVAMLPQTVSSAMTALAQILGLPPS